MGGVISQETVLGDNPLLKKLAGLQLISDNDPFWNQLFSFNLKIDDNDTRGGAQIESSLGEILQALMMNTKTTGNFAALIRVFLRRAEQMREGEQCENKIFLWQSANSLIVLRYACAFLTQRMAEAEFVRVFDKGEEEKQRDREDESDSDEEESQYSTTAEEFLDALVQVVVDLPANELSMDVHMEAVRCLQTLLSSQLYRSEINAHAIVFGYLLKGPCSSRAMDLARALLRNYLQHNTEYKRGTKAAQGESIVLGIASSMWSMVQLMAGTGGEEEEDDGSARPPPSLGSLSALLLLSLACHPVHDSHINPLKDALQSFLNAQEISSLATPVRIFKMDFSVLYERLCATVRQEPPMLLLYMLLHRNSGFRNYVLSRINLENLVVPVVRCLFDASLQMGAAASSPASSPSSRPPFSQHHTYLALIVILILSEDDFFCKLIHETVVTGVEWAEPERPLGEISLGGLIALVLIRAIHRNTLKTRDRYLHTNCLAALANMSSTFKNLSPVVCQKLIGLLEVMTKRHAKLVHHLRAVAEEKAEGKEEDDALNYHEEITVLEEGIRTALEIVNFALAGGCLRYNSHLIYTLLYHRKLFDDFAHHPMFQDLMVNIGLVISHFSTKILEEKAGDGAAVLARIEKEAVVWPTDRLKKFPELKFRYVEDDNTVDFFVPYVWRLVVEQSTIYFDPQRIRLFHAQRL